MPKVYLAGPITGCTFDGCTEWRDVAKEVLSAAGIQAFSPMRAKDYLKNYGELTGSYPDAGLFSSARNIMTRDHFDCTNADVVFAYLKGATRISSGTVMEIAWAFDRQIPLVAVIEKEGNPHSHPMIDEAIGFRAETLEDGLVIVKAILTP